MPSGHCKPAELDPGRIVFYKKGTVVSDHYYICEISYNHNGFYISLFSMEGPTISNNITLHLPNNMKTDYIMKRLDHNFETLANSLSIKNGKIKIELEKPKIIKKKIAHPTIRDSFNTFSNHYGTTTNTKQRIQPESR